MNNSFYSYTDKKLKFSDNADNILTYVRKRLKVRGYREATLTNNVYDGKEPFLDAFESMDGEPYAVILATAIANSWNESAVVIHPNEIIVGENRPTRRFMEHFSWGISDYSWMTRNFEDMHYDELYHSMEKEIDERAEKIWSKMFVSGYSFLHAEEKKFFNVDHDALEGLWAPAGYQGHTVPNYNKLLSWGLDRTLEEINKYDSNTNDQAKHDLYRAFRIIVEGLSKFAEGYSVKAREMALEADNDSDRSRLMKISENCMSVAHRAPSSYYEAAQLTWFYSLWDWVDSVGRMDQYLYPFYLNSADAAFNEEITECMMLKMWEHGIHDITLGGLIPETGEDATNDLTYLMLQAVRVIHDTHPRMTVRVHENTPEELMRLVVTMWSEGMSDPTVASDTLIVDGLKKIGVTTEDARDYTVLGCQEVEIPGKSNFGCEDGSFNIAKVLEYTLNGGYDKKTGIKVMPYGKKLNEYSDVAEIFEAYKANIEYIVPIFLRLCDNGQRVRDMKCSKLVKSVYTDDCISRGVHMDAGGAVYNYGVVETAGLAVVADSFAALEKLVFTDKAVTLSQLEAAINDNYEGHDELRAKLMAAPKFGNDDDFVDSWAVKILTHFWSELGKYNSIRGGKFLGACSLLTGGIDYGNDTRALPDGHRQGDPLGNSMGPRPGADVNGITSMLKSVTKLPLELGLGGTTLNVLVPCSETASAESKKKIADLFRTYLANGGQLAQITTASKESMLKAQKDPEHNRGLIVRVGGFSCPFVELGTTEQNEIISRYS